MLKKIAVGLFSVLTLALASILAVAATRPATYHVERSISSGAPPQAVFDVLNDMHRFPEWSPWQKLDPAMKITYDGPTSGVGASYSWTGNAQVGEGRMTITETTPPTSLTQKLEFLKPKSTCAVRFGIAPEGEGSRITWNIDGNNNYLFKVMSLFKSMDKMMGKDFEAGLASLRQVSEAAAAAPAMASPAMASPAAAETAAPSRP